MSECRFEKAADHRRIKKTPTQIFSCEFCKIFKKFLITPMSKSDLLLSLLTDLFFKNKPPASKKTEEITAEMFVSFGVVVHQRIFMFPNRLTFPRDLC